MSKKLFVFFIRSFFSRINKRGFTLAEALIITVMTGACLLPILGTMQNAQVRTENYDHQSKMQLYARSRLTAEIANAAFDHKSVSLEDEYHYIVYFASSTSTSAAEEDDAKLVELPKSYVTLEDFDSFKTESNSKNWATSAVDLLGISRNNGAPYLKVVHAYKTSVETKDTPPLAEYGNEENVIESPKALLGIVVKTSLIKSNDDYYDPLDGAMITEFDENGGIKTTDKSSSVTPVSLFAFVNLPTVSDEYIWMVASESKVIAFDPLSKTIANTLTFGTGEKEPRHIAVHPSGKMLAVQCKSYIYLVNIDVKSLKKNDMIELVYAGKGEGNKFCEGPEEGGGIAFRPDGKVLYFTDKGQKRLHKYELNYEFQDNPDRVLKWDNTTPSIGDKRYIDFTNYNDKFSNIVAANDGYLYVACAKYNNPNAENNPPNPPANKEVKVVYKYPMYGEMLYNHTLPIVETEKEIRNIDVSSDGRFLLCVPKLEDNGYALIYDAKTGKSLDTKTILTNMKISRGIFVSFSGNESEFKYNSLFIALALTGKNKNDPSCISIYNFINPTTPWAKLTIDEFTESGNLIESPVNGNIVFASKLGEGKGNEEKLLFFANYIFKNVNYNLSLDEAAGLAKKDPFDLKNADLAAKRRSILASAEGEATKTIQLYDLNTLRKLEDNYFIATFTVASLSMNAQGNMLVSSHDDYALGFYQYNILDGSTKKSNIVGSYTKKVVFDGSSPDMAFALMYEKSGNSITSEYFYNIYNEDLADRWETSSSDLNDRRNFKLDSGWSSFDIIGMPNGGALALYGKTDGSSMLEWIGRRNWGNTNVGKYKLFARWTNVVLPTNTYFPTNNYTSPGDNVDTAPGRIVVSKSTISGTLPRYVRLKTGYKDGTNTVWTSGIRYITPFILIYDPITGIVNDYKIIDYAEPIPLEPNKTYDNIRLNWKNNTNISGEYRVGFWSGNLAIGKNFGVIGYSGSDSDSSATFYSDIPHFDGLNDQRNFDTIEDLRLKKNLSSNGNPRQYSIQFYWEKEKKQDFPPLYSERIAISPDCGTLAILSRKTISENIPLLSIFDFNNFNYGPETQIEGMLVDYRELYNSATDNYSWPKEKNGSLFKKVFTGCNIASLTDFLTKYDPIKSFNKYPANYKIGSITGGGSWDATQKKYANKRFIGYYRPNSDINKTLFYYTEEPRTFYNNDLIFSSKLVTSGGPYPTAAVLSVENNSNNLLQIDQASDGNGMNLGVFFNSSITANENPSISYNSGENKFDIDNGWSSLASDFTYILKNQPSFINSYPCLTNENRNINMSFANMVFSRDRAKPILYLKGQDKLFVLYKNIFRVFDPTGGENSKDVVISEDGQKLVFGKGNNIKVYNISNPSDKFFADNENIDGTADKYLGVVATINADVKAYYLSTRPHNSYSSSKIGGDIRLVATDSFKISSNAAAVASGGIYIAQSNTNKIAVYNPSKNPSSLISKTIFKKNNNSASISSYDDKIYLFGNANVSGDPLSGRTQSYDVNTQEVMYSLSTEEFLDESSYTDEYQVNMGLKSNTDTYLDSYIINKNTSSGYNAVDGSNNSPHFRYAFLNNYLYFCRNDIRYTDVYIGYKTDYPLTVNKICVSNYNSEMSKSNQGLKQFKLFGSNNTTSVTEDKTFFTESISQQDTQTYSKIASWTFVNNDSYYGYAIKPLSNFNNKFIAMSGGTDTAEYICINFIQLWRTKVKRLTPSPQDPLLSGHSFDQKLSELPWKGNKIYWSEGQTDTANLKDIYIPGTISNSNHISNNVFSSENHGWNCNKKYPFIIVELGSPEAVCAVRYANGNKDFVKSLKIFGSNVKGSYNDGTGDVGSEWEPIKFTDDKTTTDQTTFKGPQIRSTFITAEIETPKKYSYYLIKFYKNNDDDTIRLVGFEMFSCPAKETEKPVSDYLTPMLDDNIKEITVGNSAACSTPYGLVTSGGFVGSNATTTTILYWPHAVNRFDGNFNQYGISRSLPSLKTARTNHAIVWHKGKVYAIGGKNAGDGPHNDEDNFIEVLDFNGDKIEWAKATIASYTFNPNQSIGGLYRYNHGACSFGDEIFIFGGQTGTNNHLDTAYAWNPETKKVRKLTNIECSLSPCCAVSYGSKIYIMGNDKDESNMFKVFEYTP